MKIKRQKDLYDVNNHLYEYSTWNRFFDQCQEFVQCPFKDQLVIIKEIISWLFKDTIVTMTCLNFDHVQPYSKKWPKKIKLAPNEIFSQKTTNKIFVYLCAPFIVQSFIVDPELWGCAILGPKMVHLPQTKFFFWKRILIFFSSTYWPLSLCKILKRFFQQV